MVSEYGFEGVGGEADIGFVRFVVISVEFHKNHVLHKIFNRNISC